MKRFRIALVVLGLGAAGVVAPFAIPAFAAHSSSSSSSAVVTIKVKASEFKFVLSRKTVKPGTTVIFKVTNVGVIGHDFKIFGHKTRVLKAKGGTGTLKIKFAKKGRYGYLCTVRGHAANGMKGVFLVGVKSTTTTTNTTTTSTTTTGTTTTTTVPTTCTNPTTTVTVGMFEYRFDLSQTTIPAGCVQFNIVNRGVELHNFDIQSKRVGAFLNPNQSESWAVQLTRGNYAYICDVGQHAAQGMQGILNVT